MEGRGRGRAGTFRHVGGGLCHTILSTSPPPNTHTHLHPRPLPAPSRVSQPHITVFIKAKLKPESPGQRRAGSTSHTLFHASAHTHTHTHTHRVCHGYWTGDHTLLLCSPPNNNIQSPNPPPLTHTHSCTVV